MDIIERQLRNIIIGYIEPLTAEQKLEAGTVLEKILEEIKESGIVSKSKRRWQHLTIEDGVKVYKYVLEHPEASYREIESIFGLSKRCIDNDKNEIFNGKTIKQIVLEARAESRGDRFSVKHTTAEVAQMGISSRYSRD